MSLPQPRAASGFLRHRLVPTVILAVALVAGSCGESDSDPVATAAPDTPTASPTTEQATPTEAAPSPTSEPPTPTPTSTPVVTPAAVSQPLAATATPTTTPTVERSSNGRLGPITFASGEEDNEPVDPGDRFEAGISKVYAFFDYEGLNPDDIVSSVWYQGAEEVNTITSSLEAAVGQGASGEGMLHFWLEYYDGWPSGSYRVDISLNDEFMQSGEFVVVAEALGEPFFGGVVFTTEAGDSGPIDSLPAVASFEYPAGTLDVYAVFGYDEIVPGSTWSWRLSSEGTTVDEASDLPLDVNGRGFYRLALPLPAGSALYDLELYLNGELYELASFSVGDPTPPDSRLLLEDDFEDPGSGWASLDDPAAAIAYRDGQYVLSVLSDDRLPVISVWGETYTDGVIEVDATLLAGPDDNALGLIVRYQDANNYHGLLISSDGYFAAYHYLDGTIVWDLEWTQAETDFLNLGEVTNRLRVLMVGSELRLYANGRLLLILQDALWDDGRAGVVTASFAGPDVEVGFDRWRVWGLSE